MSKELNQLKKGIANFTLVGEAKIGDYTFTIDKESQKEDSDWVYSKMNLGVDCGSKTGVIYCDLQSGYGTSRDNVVYVHGKDKDGNDDYKNFFTIAWEDREDEEILDTIGRGCFITVGLEKNEKNEVVYRKFVTPYDAVQYINDNLEKEQVVKVKGNVLWREYDGKIQMTKEVNYISISNAKPEEYEAKFTQTILTDSKSIGKLDTTTCTIPIDAYIVENLRQYKGQNISKKVDGKVKKGANLPLFKTFDFKVNKDEKEKATKFLKLFKAKAKKVTQITVDGVFSRGDIETAEVGEADIPDDIKELIELGYINKDEVLAKMAFVNGNGNKSENMIITNPRIKFKKDEIPSIDVESDLYNEDDIDINLILEQYDTKPDIQDDKPIDDKKDEDKALDEALNNTDTDEEDDDWLAGL